MKKLLLKEAISKWPEGPRMMATIMSILARREHSCHELRNKLLAGGYPSELVELGITLSANEGWIDDFRYAELYTRRRVENGFGPSKIEAELLTKGMTQACVDDVLRRASIDWEQKAVNCIDKKFKQKPETLAELRKQQRYLFRRGFTAEIIRKVISL